MKTSYHPAILIAFHLNCLPHDLRLKIPRSTQYEWLHKNLACAFGYDWYCGNKHLFSTLTKVASNKTLLQVNRALLRIIAIQHFLKKYAVQIHEKVFNASAVIVNIKKVQKVLGTAFTLKLLHLSYQRYWQLRQKLRCHKSLLNRCLAKHPAQLRQKEVNIIRRYCEDIRFVHWPLSSVYHQVIRDAAAHFHLSTFYKYTGLLKLKRSLPAQRRKNHHTGIRTVAPLQLLHADVTIFRTTDNNKAFIYLIQDNFSRAILKFIVSLSCNAQVSFKLLKEVYWNVLQPANISFCELMTDDGSEYLGPVPFVFTFHIAKIRVNTISSNQHHSSP